MSYYNPIKIRGSMNKVEKEGRMYDRSQINPHLRNEPGSIEEATREFAMTTDYGLSKDDKREAGGINDVLNERGKTYGRFEDHARITQDLKDTVRSGASWTNCTSSQKETLEMILHKIGRIVNGDPEYLDSWVDIIGYTQLIVEQLEE